MSTWRYAQNGQTLGPVETPALVELLRSGALPAETLVLRVMGIINAASGQFKPLPLIGHFELIK